MAKWKKKTLVISTFALLLQAAAASYIYFYGIPGLYTPHTTTHQVFARSKNTASPLVLSAQDLEDYKRIIQAQTKRQWKQADALIASLEQPVLVGHVLAKRYLNPAYHASDIELTNWLDRYSDHPYANDIYSKISSDTAQYLIVPKAYKELPHSKTTPLAADDSRRYWGEWAYRLVPSEAEALRQLAIAAENKIDAKPSQDIRVWLKEQSSARRLSPLANDLLTWFAGWNYYARNQTRLAYHYAQTAATRSGQKAPTLFWLAGMAAWQQGAEVIAAQQFSTMAGRLPANSADGAAAHYWAARAFQKMGETEQADKHRHLAAENANSFYGMLAASESNHPLQLANVGRLTAPDWSQWLKEPAIARAASLKQLGLDNAAKRHLAHGFTQANASQKIAIMSASNALNYTSVASQMQGYLNPKQNRFWWAQLPVPEWKPRDGWRLPKALVLAVAQHESAMKSHAESHAGAQGLMQLMPLTASAMADLSGWPDVPELKNVSHALTQPELNLTLGQRYLHYLGKQPEVNGNLIAMLAAYNAGPTPIGEWLATHRADKDPLSFIESIPYAETRNYVQQTLMLYWAYSARLGTSQESLVALSQAQWPSLFSVRDLADNTSKRL